MTGLTKRLANQTPAVTPQRLHRVRRFARRHLFKQFERVDYADILTFEEWLEGTIYTAKRKNELREVYKRLTVEYENERGTEFLERRVGSFVKDEGYPERKVSRWINASPDEFKVIYGPIVHTIEKRLFKHPSFIKTIPVEDRAQAIYDQIYLEGAEYVETDYTSFEAHFTSDKMKLWHDFVFHSLGIDPRADSSHLPLTYEAALNMNIHQQALYCLREVAGLRQLRMNHFGTFSMIARRCSGEMDTSSANGYSNWLMTEFAAHRMGCGVSQVVEGDDGLARYHGRAPDDQFFLKYGWNIKLLKVRALEEASFCGLRFDPVDRIVVCDIREAIAKFGLTNGRYVSARGKMLVQLTRAKALSLCCQYSQVPMLGALARRALQLTSGVNIRKSIIDSYDLYDRANMLRYVKQKPWEVPFSPPTRTRELVQKLYNITIPDQIAFEKQIMVHRPGPFRLGSFCVLDPHLEKHSLLIDGYDQGLAVEERRHYYLLEQLRSHWGKQLRVVRW